MYTLLPGLNLVGYFPYILTAPSVRISYLTSFPHLGKWYSPMHWNENLFYNFYDRNLKSFTASNLIKCIEYKHLMREKSREPIEVTLFIPEAKYNTVRR